MESLKCKKCGKLIEGTYIKLKPNSGKYNSNAYHIETEKDKKSVVFGSIVLDDRMELVSVGDRIKIIFKGIEKSEGKQDYKNFEVLVDKDYAPLAT